MIMFGNILVIGNSSQSITGDIAEELEIAETFKQFGFEVEFWDRAEAIEKMKVVPFKEYHFIFIANNNKLGVLDIHFLKEKFKTLIIYWLPDYRDIGTDEKREGIMDILKAPDLVLIRQLTYLDRFQEERIRYHYWNFDVALSIFQKEFDEEIYKNKIQPCYPNPLPISFIGNWVHNPWRMKFLWEVQRHFPDKMYVTTIMPNEFITGQIAAQPSEYKLKNVRYALFGHAFNTLVNITKINLSLDWIVAEGYWSPRTARIMCAGGFVMVHHTKGMEKVFGSSGVNLVYFDSVEDCVEKIKYYLEHEKERKKIAERGYKYANEFLRPKVRVKELLDYVETLPRR